MVMVKKIEKHWNKKKYVINDVSKTKEPIFNFDNVVFTN